MHVYGNQKFQAITCLHLSVSMVITCVRNDNKLEKLITIDDTLIVPIRYFHTSCQFAVQHIDSIHFQTSLPESA